MVSVTQLEPDLLIEFFEKMSVGRKDWFEKTANFEKNVVFVGMRENVVKNLLRLTKPWDVRNAVMKSYIRKNNRTSESGKRRCGYNAPIFFILVFLFSYYFFRPPTSLTMALIIYNATLAGFASPNPPPRLIFLVGGPATRALGSQPIEAKGC